MKDESYQLFSGPGPGLTPPSLQYRFHAGEMRGLAEHLLPQFPGCGIGWPGFGQSARPP